MNSQKLKIGLPPEGITRYYLYSFLQNLSRKVNINIYDTYIEIISNFLKEDYIEAFELVKEKIENFKTSFPASNNDKKILTKIKIELGLPKEADIKDIFEKYIASLENVSLEDIQKDLYPFTGKGKFASPSIFKVELYGYTRGPYFSGKYKLDFNFTLHQFMLFSAGYLWAKCLKARKGRDWLSILLFPPSANHIPELLITKEKDINQDIIEKKNTPRALIPVEALILWFAANLEKPVDFYLVGMKDPGGMKPAETSLDIFLPLSNFYKSSEAFFKKVRKSEKLKNTLNSLVIKALEKEFQDQVKDKRGAKQSIDDAIEYVKLLFLACQEGRFKERLELALRSSRRLIIISKEKEQERYEVANLSRILADNLIQ